jgi:diguanylate cyclase (GGDEF)-like protein
LAEEVVAGMRDGLALHDGSGRLVGWNPAAQSITGWDRENVGDRLRPDLPDGLNDLGDGCWVDLRRFSFRRHGRTYTATIFTDARHQVALRDAYAKVNELVTTDPLTGLPNRLLADDRLRLSVSLAQRDKRPVALLFIDLDRFKLVNETLGHQVGDELLEQVAIRLRRSIRESDTVARVGGDEFVVILHTIGQSEGAEHVAAAVLRSMTERFTLEGHEVYLGCSIGIAVFPEHGERPETLRSHAELAMRQAKEEGGNAIRLYAPIMSEHSRERLTIAGDLHRALDRDELVVNYQPQIDIDSGLAVGAEALVRWLHPTRGLMPPDEFLAVAEEDGSILDIDRWVLRTACQQMRRWDERGLHLPMVAVNLSARTMVHGDVSGMVVEALTGAQLSPERLEIEVSEHVVAGQAAEVAQRLVDLKALGVQLAIDDFGAGYSSLGHLKRYPIDTIKLDRSFVIDVTGQPDPTDIAVLRAVVSMASDLHLRCIAEGVETREQRKVLRFLQCHLVQGYLYSRPLPPAELWPSLDGPMLPPAVLAGG